MNSKLVVAGGLAFSFLALFAGDCETIDATNTGTDGGNGNGGPITTPEALLAAHEDAWNERDYEAYEALLDEEFEFCPLEEDVADLPWLEGDCWSRSDELCMIWNLFDPVALGVNGFVELGITEQSRRSIGEGRIESSCTAHGRVMWTPTDGASFDTRLAFELVERDGGLRIIRISEIPRAEGRTRDEPPPFAHSLGRLKSQFFDPSRCTTTP
jgi:hypothetical protein